MCRTVGKIEGKLKITWPRKDSQTGRATAASPVGMKGFSEWSRFFLNVNDQFLCKEYMENQQQQKNTTLHKAKPSSIKLLSKMFQEN